MRGLNSVHVSGSLLLSLIVSLGLMDPSVALADTIYGDTDSGNSPAMRMPPTCVNCSPTSGTIDKEEWVYENGCYIENENYPHRHITFICQKMQCSNGWYYRRQGDSILECESPYGPATCPGGTCAAPPPPQE